MKKQIRLIAIILAVMMAIQACRFNGGLDSEKEIKPRTYYESLNLETPEDAVETFAKAFQKKDFMTVYLVFDYETQKQIRIGNAATFGWGYLIGSDSNEHIWDDLNTSETYAKQIDFWYIFDQVMLYAAKEDDLLIDLRGDLAILESEESMTNEGKQAVDVIASVDGVRGEVIFCTVIDLDDRWRVYNVSAPDEEIEFWPFLEASSSQ